MNIRKNIDYSELFAALIEAMNTQGSQMELYCEIGRLVAGRPEKGAAVAAAEFLSRQYPESSGLSPRNLRRMRAFYQQYGNDPIPMGLALSLGWTQNVTILEADLDDDARAWYLGAAKAFGWSKSEIQTAIMNEVHLHIITNDKTANDVSRQNQSILQIDSHWNFHFSVVFAIIKKVIQIICCRISDCITVWKCEKKPKYKPPDDGWPYGRWMVQIYEVLVWKQRNRIIFLFD